ncbi:hypothetical protein MRB53_002362 [Persea americana]|uniref:Uncharacterized protein n=1 Tax=Persea americana TaxID=3435 RepID=A0ACC2MUH6_PERAE|nr:hypothetical protein MRB53_002362 [Persea americana]
MLRQTQIGVDFIACRTKKPKTRVTRPSDPIIQEEREYRGRSPFVVDAASVSSLMTTTEAVVVELPKDEKEAPIACSSSPPQPPPTSITNNPTARPSTTDPDFQIHTRRHATAPAASGISRPSLTRRRQRCRSRYLLLNIFRLSCAKMDSPRSKIAKSSYNSSTNPITRRIWRFSKEAILKRTSSVRRWNSSS